MIDHLVGSNVPEELINEYNSLNDQDQVERFSSSLEFGTAGIRGLIGVGSNRMNILTVRKVTIGLAHYLIDKFEDNISIAIAFDSRHYSREFTEEVIKVLSTFNIKTYTFEDPTPTPLLSFAIREFNCNAGIVITASHNPKDYNGYKVYNNTGAQVSTTEANDILSFFNKVENEQNFEYTNDLLVEYISRDIYDTYLKRIESISILDKEKKDIKVVFSPAHGTSNIIGPKALDYFGVKNIITVDEQMTPDGNFTNIETSNPEDEKAFTLAIKYLEKNNADLILINDPDADRLGVAIRNRDNEIIFLDANSIASLLIEYFIVCNKIKDNSIVYSSIVSGQMLVDILKANNVLSKQSLVGFKYIGENIENNKDKDLLFGFEESCGYLFNPSVRDKDGIQALVVITQLTNYYLNKDMYLDEVLLKMNEKYGYYNDSTLSFVFSNQAEAKEKMIAIRSFDQDNLSGYKIKSKVDFLDGVDDLPKDNLVRFNFEEIGKLTFRPSGTEPKLKVYVAINSNTKEKTEQIFTNLISEINNLFIK
ncbi:MAG: phospho-sugar mutase [Mycoplasmatales bacterium]